MNLVPKSVTREGLSKRVHALGYSDFESYLHHVESDGEDDELVQLLDVISTNVTHFFREPDHFKFLRKYAEDCAARGQERFRLWCAASSTGEEPYTLAMTLAEAFADSPGLDWSILATDISTRVLEIASMATYSGGKVEGIPSLYLGKYFRKSGYGDDANYQALPTLRDRVTFRRLNLSQPPFPMKGPLDVIFCRNVMIYFDNPVRQRLLADCHRLLKPGGYLIVGHSESLTGILSPFKGRFPSIYQKAKA
jgi:chemotaxis protein methyltransferase CheR